MIYMIYMYDVELCMKEGRELRIEMIKKNVRFGQARHGFVNTPQLRPPC